MRRGASHSEAATARCAAVRCAVFIAALMLVRVAAGEPVVSARDGNIFLRDSGGQERQLTSSGRDSDPVLAPDGKWVVFIRALPGKKIESGAGEHDAAELWQVRADGKEPLMLVRTRGSDKMENLIAGFEDVQFSSDGRLVYFVTPAWATSGAVHVVDTTNRKEHFVVAGYGLRVLHSGDYRDHLLLAQHRYFLCGGSYDWFYLFTAEGKEVGVVGEDTQNFLSTYGDEASKR